MLRGPPRSTRTYTRVPYSTRFRSVRGGLQGIGRGQYEAAGALGFGFWSMQGYVVLPQALRSVVPAIVNAAIALFKDTTYVMVVGLFDLLNIVVAGLSDANWIGLAAEGYVFAIGRASGRERVCQYV